MVAFSRALNKLFDTIRYYFFKLFFTSCCDLKSCSIDSILRAIQLRLRRRARLPRRRGETRRRRAWGPALRRRRRRAARLALDAGARVRALTQVERLSGRKTELG